MALKQKDLKAILAYSTISQLGLIIALLGFGTEAAICAAIFHLFNHSAFKGSLFLMTGIVDHQTGTRDVSVLKGLIKVMPFTGAIALIGGFAMAGLPPFNGFLSKEMFLAATVEAPVANLAFMGGFAYIIPIVAVVASLFTFVYSISIFAKVFLGKQLTTETPKTPKESGWGMLIPALLLVSLNIFAGFFPNFFAKYLLDGAATVVTGTTQHMHIAFWHGFNLPLLMTTIVILGGLIIYSQYDKIKPWLMKHNWDFGANKAYEKGLVALPKVAGKITDVQITGRLGDYSSFTVVAAMLLIAGTMIYYRIWNFIAFKDLASVDIMEVTLCIVVMAAAIAVGCFRRRLWSVMCLSLVGYGVSFFFVLFRAPDLALTQLLVETISTVLFLLVMYKMPYGNKEDPPESLKRKLSKLAIALSVGITMFTVTMLAHSNKLFESIAWYYVENSKIKGGGNNIVNVILVDFRGLDTMGEITVLGIAAMGVFVVIKMGRNLLLNKEGKSQVKTDAFNDTGVDSAAVVPANGEEG